MSLRNSERKSKKEVARCIGAVQSHRQMWKDASAQDGVLLEGMLEDEFASFGAPEGRFKETPAQFGAREGQLNDASAQLGAPEWRSNDALRNSEPQKRS